MKKQRRASRKTEPARSNKPNKAQRIIGLAIFIGLPLAICLARVGPAGTESSKTSALIKVADSQIDDRLR